MTVESLDLAISLARVASEWDSVSGLDGTLIRVTEGVRQTIPEVAYASITTRGPKRELNTLAPTDVIADRADQLQYAAAEGPCYEVVTTAVTLAATEDLVAEHRWPTYAPSAAALALGHSPRSASTRTGSPGLVSTCTRRSPGSSSVGTDSWSSCTRLTPPLPWGTPPRSSSSIKQCSRTRSSAQPSGS